MTLVEHLAELRTRLVRIALALVVGAIVGYVLFDSLLGFITGPYCNLDTAFRPAGPGGECKLVAIRALEPFSVRIKTALVFGAFVTGPVIFYQLWRFVAPGLTGTEKRYAAPFVILSQLMFAFGIAFAYFIIPQGLRILLGFGGDQIAPALTAGEYLSFILTTSVAFGIVFEVPLVLVFLGMLGVVSSDMLRRFRPYAVVANMLVAAIVTPTTDAVTLFFMAGPMIIFYEAAIWTIWTIERRRRKRAA